MSIRHIERNAIQMNLIDLPDEILLFILKKINVVDVLFQLSSLHTRLEQLVFDPLYIRKIDFTIKSWDGTISSMNDVVIDHVCEKILPHISDKIIKLTLTPDTIGRVLHVDYPNLSSLSLMNFPRKILIQYLTKDSGRIQLMDKEMKHLHVHTIDEIDNDNDELNLLELILSFWKSLIEFTLHHSIESGNRNRSISSLSSTIYFSLTKLNIQLNEFEECLHLFDGRFPSLSHCSAYINNIFSISSSIDNKTILSKLKYFSLTSYIQTHVYDDVVVPFLQRMSNLEELDLFLTVAKRDTVRFVDGNDLKNNILIHLSRLKIFHFSIYTYLYQLNNHISNKNDYPSNDDIQQSFISNKFAQVGSYVHYGLSHYTYECHVYSLPYQFNTFIRLNSLFTNHIFTYVRTLTINDFVTWDYHFFNRVNQSFPFVEILMIYNCSAYKKPSQLNNNFEQFPIVTFNRLIDLRINLLHDNYIQQLLCNRYTRLPRLYQLIIGYEQLVTLTNNFTDNPTQFNCLQVQKLIIKECFVRPQNFSLFFPLL